MLVTLQSARNSYAHRDQKGQQYIELRKNASKTIWTDELVRLRGFLADQIDVFSFRAMISTINLAKTTNNSLIRKNVDPSADTQVLECR